MNRCNGKYDGIRKLALSRESIDLKLGFGYSKNCAAKLDKFLDGKGINMRLTPNLDRQILNAERRYIRLKERFEEFKLRLDYFAEANCPIRGVRTEIVENQDYVEVSFATVRICLTFLVVQAEAGNFIGKIICTLRCPKFVEIPVIIGQFTFDGQGRTDFEVDEDDDPIEIDGHAIELVLHFLHLALARIDY